MVHQVRWHLGCGFQELATDALTTKTASTKRPRAAKSADGSRREQKPPSRQVELGAPNQPPPDDVDAVEVLECPRIYSTDLDVSCCKALEKTPLTALVMTSWGFVPCGELAPAYAVRHAIVKFTENVTALGTALPRVPESRAASVSARPLSRLWTARGAAGLMLA
jgi:hypothetical protein